MRRPGVRGHTGGNMFTLASCTHFPRPLVVTVESGCQFVMMSEIMKSLMNVVMNVCEYL